ncbi:MAG: four-carbon acid sugar kinase family protein [Betaproteobacteria bacterium]|nr:four-carbon acid sugar kinase family protein [Betaproteobacteria bacterium]
MILGCIADDFTGATDLANTLTRGGMATVVLFGVPREDLAAPGADAIVIALKSRSIAAGDAVRQSLAALTWLQQAGPGPAPRESTAIPQIFFKYCSTFDSTDAGNIGPVAEALLAALGETFTIACPAFPTNKRTIYRGYLFVGDVLLSESSMRYHPLTPMTDALLTRVLQRQSKGRVGLIAYDVVERGAAAVREAMERLHAEGVRMAIVDALTDAHLVTIGAACARLKLLTGGSGLALGLPENFRRAGLLRARTGGALPAVHGHAAVIAGSCSAATQRQVAEMKRRSQWFEIDPIGLREDSASASKVLQWARPRLGREPILIYSTADPGAVEKAQAALGREQAGRLIETAMGEIAKGLVDMGVRQLVVAGGETSGAVASALGVEGLWIGEEIDPGVPWTFSLGEPPLALALKSGNFGTDDFFLKAFQKLEPPMNADGRFGE